VSPSLFFKFRLKPFKIIFTACPRHNNFVKCFYSLEIIFGISISSPQLPLFQKYGQGYENNKE
jgi:hypothetical protein